MRKKAKFQVGVRGAMLGTMGFSAVLTIYGLKAKFSFGSSVYEGKERLEGKTVIVTGANSGIGKSTATELLRRGGRLIMACRDVDKCEEARREIMEITSQNNVVCRKLDLASLDSVRQFADNINKTEDRVDILVNNAGVMGIKERIETEDGFEMHAAVNYFGPFLLTHLLLDKLKANAPSRIINVMSPTYKANHINFSDINFKDSYNASKAYGRSKAALASFNLKMAELLDNTGVTTYAPMPGVVDTNLKRHQITSPWKQFVSKFTSWLQKTPESGSQTVLFCALNPLISDQSGFPYRECQREDNEGSVNRQLPRERLYLTSLVWTGLKDADEAKREFDEMQEMAKS